MSKRDGHPKSSGTGSHKSKEDKKREKKSARHRDDEELEAASPVRQALASKKSGPSSAARGLSKAEKKASILLGIIGKDNAPTAKALLDGKIRGGWRLNPCLTNLRFYPNICIPRV